MELARRPESGRVRIAYGNSATIVSSRIALGNIELDVIFVCHLFLVFPDHLSAGVVGGGVVVDAWGDSEPTTSLVLLPLLLDRAGPYSVLPPDRRSAAWHV